MSEITVGTVVLAGHGSGPWGGLGVVTQVGKLHGSEGAWIVDHTGDPGATTGYPTFSPAWCIKPAVVGATVCEKPRFDCYCGRAHVHRDALTSLPRKEVSRA